MHARKLCGGNYLIQSGFGDSKCDIVPHAPAEEKRALGYVPNPLPNAVSVQGREGEAIVVNLSRTWRAQSNQQHWQSRFRGSRHPDERWRTTASSRTRDILHGG